MQSFPRAVRLNKAGDFSSVFIFRKARFGVHVKMHYKPNELSYPRLGVIVGKKVHKRSNKRNYMKRILREWFRCNRAQLRNCDILLRVVKYFDHLDYVEVWQELDALALVLLK